MKSSLSQTGSDVNLVMVNAPLTSCRLGWRPVAALCLGWLLLVSSGRAESARAGQGASSNPLVWDAPLKQLKMEGMGKLAEFTFWVTNTASTNVAILRTETTCDCTVGDLPSNPWILRPNEVGPFKVRLNTTGKFGWVTNRVGLLTSEGVQVLTVIAEIPLTPAPFQLPVRERDRMIAMRDRQAVFRDPSCYACHGLPALGKSGADLYSAACSICHDAEHRAAMVPDLTALKKVTDAAYWREWITHGKDGSLMPAFAESGGGILSPDQIESLVDYLMKDERFRP